MDEAEEQELAHLTGALVPEERGADLCCGHGPVDEREQHAEQQVGGDRAEERLQVDGRTVFASEPVEGGKPPVPVSVPVAGAKTLTLIVSLVPKTKMPKGMTDGPELDNAVWARPLLIR